MSKQLCIWLLLCFFFTPLVIAQSTYIPLQNWDYHTIDRTEIKSGEIDPILYTSVKPYKRKNAVILVEDGSRREGSYFSILDRYNNAQFYKNHSEHTDWGLIESKKPIFKHFYKYKSDFFYLRQVGDFELKINPVIHWQFNKEFGTSNFQGSEIDELHYINTRGIELRGSIADRLGFYTYLGENQRSFPQYVMSRVFAQNGAIPYEGRFKNFDSRIGTDVFALGADYFTVRGYVTFQAVKDRIDVQFGHDRNFIGNGVRSMLLSDFSAPYLFLKLNTRVWKFNYQNLFMELVSQHNRGADRALPKKYAAIHHLSVNPTKWLNIGFFESVVFDRDNGFDLQYLNPLIFYRAVEFQLGSADNVILGMDFKANFKKHFSIYGQLVVDEFSFDNVTKLNGWWANKVGGQLGFKYIDVAKISNLDWQIEFNVARPYLYSHNSEAGNYSHFNQALAHPLGANFWEVLNVFRYKPHKQLFFKLNVLYSQQGLDLPDGLIGSEAFINNGSNILKDNDNNRPNDFGNHLLQGIKTNVLVGDLTISYMWKHNLFLDLTYTGRFATSDPTIYEGDNHYIGLGMRLNIARQEYLF